MIGLEYLTSEPIGVRPCYAHVQAENNGEWEQTTLHHAAIFY